MIVAMRAMIQGLILACLWATVAVEAAESPFKIRGTLPWHNFLCGPTAWNESDYVVYLDRLKALDLNYVTFHCYTGGAERYASYVEPLVAVTYRDVLPLATLDTSLTARWGYRPLKVRDFAFGTDRLFKLPKGASAFGADCALLARNNEEQYAFTQGLMRKVIAHAHKRGIQVGIGFEFGIHPPELASIVPPQSMIRGTMLPDPTHPASMEILRNTLDNLLEAYPDVDWIWLWLHEHTMYVGKASPSAGFRKLMEEEGRLFDDAGGEDARFTGVWSLAYIRAAHEYLARKAPKVKLAISGWGGGAQLPGILRGLNRIVPRDVVFTCLNPNQGWDPQLPVLAEIAHDRPVWAIPWLEGDARLWHPQPRVSLLHDQVVLAEQQKLEGVLAIHWRTEDVRANLDAFATFARNPAQAPTVEAFYEQDCIRQYGDQAAHVLSPMLCRWDRQQAIVTDSPEYYAYDPSWGRLNASLREQLTRDLALVLQCVDGAKDVKHKANLKWLAANVRFTLLLDEAGQCLEPAYRLKEQWLAGRISGESLSQEALKAREALNKAPLEALFTTYASRVRSRGELGVLSSMNQRLWLQDRELRQLLTSLTKTAPGLP